MERPENEVWTEEEVIEFGLAGEEEFCDLDGVEANVELSSVAQNVELTESTVEAMNVQPFGEMPDVGVTKSGRVRKKSAKWMEMEETDELEKIILGPSKLGSRRGRSSGGGVGGTSKNISMSSIDQQQFPSLNDDGAQLQLQNAASSDRQVKVRFNINSPAVTEVARKGGRPSSSKKDGGSGKRKRSSESSSFMMESDAEIEFGEQPLFIDDPLSSGVGHEPLRMRLTMASDLTASIASSNDILEQYSPKKAQKMSKRKSLMLRDDHFASGGHFIGDGLITVVPLAQGSLPVLDDRTSIAAATDSECDVTDYLPPRNRHKKNFASDNEGVTSAQHGEVNYHRIGLVKTEAGSLDRQQQSSREPNLQRKPKKKRQKGYTAYMLWCGTQRAKLVAVNPGIDFAAVSKRLGDMWQTVPEKEKMTWRRKARRLSKKGTSLISTGKMPREGGPARRGRPPSIHRTGDISRSLYHGNKMIKFHSPGSHDDLASTNFKVVGTSPLDAAAHLKLLGESLAVIGSRLQEHRGQIAVQGSLSVLLDSMLCALGSLMCLTSQVPELNGASEELHTSTLNNIAFIMPGVG